MTDKILIIDFGAQYTQLIARRVRESGVYCEIQPFNAVTADSLARFAPKGVILSGGPASVHWQSAPRVPGVVLECGVPVLGICYGQQTMCAELGAMVSPSVHREFGRAFVDVTDRCALFDGVWAVGAREQVWMSHGDRVESLPEGFRAVARSEGAPFAAIANDGKHFYGVQFHPEVVHTPHGAALLKNFTHAVCGCAGDWTMAGYKAQSLKAIREQIGSGKVICGLSGGVDSAVTAVLLHEAVGDQLACVFVDHGFMRSGEADEVVRLFKDHFNIALEHVDASDTFLSAIAGETDPEKKRKTIGGLFIDVFEAEAGKIGGADFLAQGTLYPDVIESVSFTGGPSVTIKSHHNVGGLRGTDEHAACRAVARIIQRRGARSRPGTGPARCVCRPSSLPRSGSGHPHSRPAGHV